MFKNIILVIVMLMGLLTVSCESDVSKQDNNTVKTEANLSVSKDETDKVQEEEKRKREAEKEEANRKEKAKRVNSEGVFVDKRYHDLIKQGLSLEDDYVDGREDLSSEVVELSNIKGINADISFAFSKRNGSCPINGAGKAKYVGNGEWRFIFENNAWGKMGIGVVKIESDKAYFYYDEVAELGNGSHIDENGEEQGPFLDENGDEILAFIDQNNEIVYRPGEDNGSIEEGTAKLEREFKVSDYEKLKKGEATILFRTNKKEI